MSELPPTEGLVIDYSSMTPTPVIIYNSANNTMIFNSQIQTENGVSSGANAGLVFRSPAEFRQGVQIGILNYTQFTPMPLPDDPFTLNIPILTTNGTIQATDIMVAKDGVMEFYCDKTTAVFNGDLKVQGNIQNINLQNQIDNIQLTPGATGPQGATGLTGAAEIS